MSTDGSGGKARSLAPREHGAYGQLGVPLVTALAVARPGLAAIALAAAALTALPAGAQTTATVRGRVVDAATRAPLGGAEVAVEGGGTPLAARADADGAWRLAGVPGGPRVLVARRIGYATARVTLPLAPRADTSVVIALAPAARPLDAMVVTAARRAQRLADVAVTTELVTRQDIEDAAASDVASVLAERTGMQLTGGHPSGAGIALQGLGDQRVLVLVDGVPLYGRISGAVDLSRLPTSAVERVEVVKGPQSTLYGSEAMGGVINVITRGAAERSDVELRALFGSDRRADTDLFAATRRGALAAAANLGHRFVERTPGVAGAAGGGAMVDRVDGLATLRWAPEGRAVTAEAAALAVSERQRWRSGGGTLYDFADNTQVNARLGAAWTGGAGRLSSTLALSSLDHLARTGARPTPVAGTGDRQEQRLVQGDVLYTRPLGAVVLDAGTQARQEFITSSDGRVAGGRRTLLSAEPYAQAEWSAGRWSVVPGARLSWNEQWGAYLSPRAALRVRVDPSLTLRASAGRGFRAPDFKELYLDFTNEGASYAVRGNAALRPERSDNVSLGAEWDRGRLYARGQLYWNELRDLIETRPLPDAGGFAQYTYGNVDRATTRGAELEGGVTLGALRAEAGYAYLYARDLRAAAPLLGQAAHSARAQLAAPLPFGVRATATAVHTGRAPMARDDAGAVTATRDPFTRLDLRAARPLLGRAELSVGVDNVFDARPARWPGVTSRQLFAGVTWRARAARD
jgi:outer membrane receptor for ferrienterochelin and colicins